MPKVPVKILFLNINFVTCILKPNVNAMKRSILSFVFLIGVGFLFAQVSMVNSVLATAGDFQTNGSYSLSWTVGELAVSTLTEGSNVLTQGFQQPWAMTGSGSRSSPMVRSVHSPSEAARAPGCSTADPIS